MATKKTITKASKIGIVMPFNPNRRCKNCTYYGVIVETTGEVGCKLLSASCVNSSERSFYDAR